MPSSEIPSEKAFRGIAPSRKVLRRGSNPTPATIGELACRPLAAARRMIEVRRVTAIHPELGSQLDASITLAPISRLTAAALIDRLARVRGAG